MTPGPPWLPGPPTPWWIPRWVSGPDGEAHVQLHLKPATLCGRPASRKEHPVTSFCAKCQEGVDRWDEIARSLQPVRKDGATW